METDQYSELNSVNNVINVNTDIILQNNTFKSVSSFIVMLKRVLQSENKSR